MKIAVSSENASASNPVDPRFGRAKYFMIYDTETKNWECINNAQNLHSAQGAGIQAAATIVNNDCSVLISGHCGPKAFAALSKANVEVYLSGNSTVEEALQLYFDNKLEKASEANAEGHW
jgi:predicted Fe-Mo cluster-binding NifX family protein